MKSKSFVKEIRKEIKETYRCAYVGSARLQRYQIVHFLHVGKTGGNAIRHALELGKEKPRAVNGRLLLQRAHNVTLEMCPEGDAVVFVVRHPVSRFVSAFWSRYRRGQHDPDALSAGETTAFEQFATPEELAAALSNGNPAKSSAAQKAMHEIEHVRHTLTFYLSSPSYLWARRRDILHIGFQERLDADLPVLVDRLRISAHTYLPNGSQEAHRTPTSFSRALSDQARANLEWWYADDIQIYRTCCDLAGQLDAADRDPTP